MEEFQSKYTYVTDNKYAPRVNPKPPISYFAQNNLNNLQLLTHHRSPQILAEISRTKRRHRFDAALFHFGNEPLDDGEEHAVDSGLVGVRVRFIHLLTHYPYESGEELVRGFVVVGVVMRREEFRVDEGVGGLGGTEGGGGERRVVEEGLLPA